MTDANVLEILTSQGLHRPITLTVAITGACNLHCLHCWVNAGTTASAPHAATRNLLEILTRFKGLEGRGVRITGGEPLCHPDWLTLMRHSRQLDFDNLILQTNAMLLTHENVASLRELDFPGFSLQISLDGATAMTHDLVRGAGAFAGVMAGIELLASAGLTNRVTLFFTEMRHNLGELPALFVLAESLGIGAVVTATLVAGGRAAAGAAIAPPDPEQYLKLLQRYDNDSRFKAGYDRLGSCAAIAWRTAATPRTECCTFVENPYITPDSRMFPCLMCHSDDFAVAGVFENGLSATLAAGARLWSNLQQISRSRAAALDQCRNCPDEVLCAGGCMGRALGACGDLRAADDRCVVRRLIYRQR